MVIKQRPVALVLVVLFGILSSACNRDPQIRKRKYYNKALELLQKGRVESAKLELLNAVKIDQLYAEADTTLAEIYYRETRYKQAYSLIRQALQGNPDYLPAHKAMAQFDRMIGKLPDAQKDLEFVLAHTPNDIDALMNLGRLQAMQGKLHDAEGSFNRVLGLQPGHAEALLALFSVSQARNEMPAAERFLQLALEKNPHSVPVYLTLFRFYITTGRAAETEALFPQALKDTNNDVQILSAQVGYYEGTNRIAEAEALVTKIQTAHAKEPEYWGALAEFYVRTNKLPQAKAEVERLLKLHKEDVNLMYKLIEIQIDMGDRKTATSMNDALLQKNKDDNYAHLLKGRLALADGNLELAATEFNKAQQFRADWSAVRFWRAQLLIRRGEFPQAKQELETALTYDPEYRTARVVLASLENHTGAVAAGQANAIRLLRANPHDLPALLAYSESLILNKEYDRAEKALKLAMNVQGSAELHRQLGILHLSRKNIPAALREFRLAWDLQPSSRQLLENVDLGYVVANQLASGIEFLQQAVRSRPGDAVVRVELAKMYLWGGKRDDGIRMLQEAMKVEPANPESDILLAAVFTSGKQTDLAAGVLATAVHKTGATADLLTQAGMIFEQLQRWDDARDCYERSLTLDSANAIAKNNLAAVLADHGGDLNVALRLAAQAKEAMVDNPEISSTLGWIYYKRQLYPLAYKYLTECASKNQKNPVFQYQLGMTQWKMGNPAEARRLLKKALAIDPHFPGAADATSALSQMGPG